MGKPRLDMSEITLDAYSSQIYDPKPPIRNTKLKVRRSSRRKSLEEKAAENLPSGKMVIELAELQYPDERPGRKKPAELSVSVFSEWADNLLTNSPRRMPPKIEGKDHLPPRFRRVTPEKNCPSFNFSFACGGWLQFYLFGVAKCLTDHGLHAVSKNQKFIGSSAGALVAAGLGLDGCWDVAVSYCKSKIIPQAWTFPKGPFQISMYLRDSMVRCLDVELVPQLEGEVIMVVTRFPSLRAERISSFRGGAHMCDTLLASAACIPLASAIKLDIGWCIDGGLTEFQPRLDPSLGETIYVSPFYFSGVDICPSRYVPVWWAILPPPQPSTVDWLYDLGYLDTLNWMKKRGISRCCSHCSAFADITECPMRPPRAPHPFDDPKSITLARIIGYGLENCVFDAILYFWIQVLWKPATFLLIISEFWLLTCAKITEAIIIEFIPLSPIISLLIFTLIPNYTVIFLAIILLLIVRICVFGSTAKDKWKQTIAYARNLWRLIRNEFRKGVLRKSIRRESTEAMENIAKQSIVYRMTSHIL